MQPQEFKNILQKSYKRNDWLSVLNHMAADKMQRLKDTNEPLDKTSALSNTDRNTFKKLTQIGTFITSEGERMPIYEVMLQPTVRIDRNRVQVNEIIKKLILTDAIKAALCVFYYESENESKNTEWRFSFISKFAGSDFFAELETQETNPKRFTYIFGTQEQHLTARQRFQALRGSNFTIDDFFETFAIEGLSKEFFYKYRDEHYKKFVEHLNELSSKATFFKNDDAEKEIRDFVKKILGRIVFLYFVQKKGWLGASALTYKDGDLNFMENYFKATGENEGFYPNYLTKLFFETLNAQRKNDDFEMPDGESVKIPYLNGGLFENENELYNLLTFPPSLFQNLFSFLNEYNFTVYENSPDDHVVAVDPEMLGNIFENLLEDNKDKGAFYTPKEIVQYMCQQSIIEYLATKLNTESAQIEPFVKHKNQQTAVAIKQYAVAINQALDEVKICDPAIGSGAFPMGLLQEIFDLKIALYQLLSVKIIEQNTGFDDMFAEVKANIIQNSIYGVDIEKGAVDIARLRFWLSLVVDEQTPKALPNLDYKIMVGNSLMPMFEGEPLQIDWGKKYSHGTASDFIKNIRQGLTKITDLQRQFFNADSKNKTALSQKIRQTKINILINQLKFDREKYRESNSKKGGLMPTPKEIKQNLEVDLQIQTFNNNIQNLEKLEKDTSKPLNYFSWELDFPDILNPMLKEEIGFDIIIGNPPYVRADNPKIADQRKAIIGSNYYKTLWEKWDLMVPFYERSLNMLRKNGVHSFIVSNSITTSKYAQRLQDWVLEKFHVNSIDYFENVKTFDAGVVPVITNISNHQNSNISLKKIRKDSFHNITITEIPHKNTSNLKTKIFKKHFSDIFFPTIETERFGDICYISVGIVPNADEKIAKGLFDKDDLISDVQTERCPKPYVEGKMIDAYQIEKIKYFEWNTDRVPALIRRPTFPELYEGEKILRGRVTKGTVDNTGIICNDSIVVFKRFGDLKKATQRSITSSIAKNNLSEIEKKVKGSQKKTVVNQRRRALEQLSQGYSLKYVLAMINSSYAIAYLNNFRKHRLKNYFYPDDFRNYPLPKIDLFEQVVFDILVDYILFLKTQNFEDIQDEFMSVYFEQIIDGLVYELYFEDILAENERTVKEHLGDLPSIERKEKSEKLELIKIVFNRLNDLKHPIRNNLHYLNNIPEIRKIEERR